MNYWIFTAAPHTSNSESLTAREMYDCRMKDKFWGLGEHTPNRTNIRKGDQVVFYLARPEQVFVGTAKLGTDSYELGTDEKFEMSHGSAILTAQYGVRLEEIKTWETARPMVRLAATLNFVTNRAQWWTHLQGGVRQVEERDFAAITTSFPSSEPVGRINEELESQSLFALEAHLEDFIARNWSQIPWGTKLELYQNGEQSGQQFPAGTWSIDFLAVDREKNEFVVIELKRGKTSDAAVGQVLRYMNWVRENLAEQNQNVQGIIIASEIDESLRYAARGLANVSVKTYNVTFSLQPEEL